MDFSIENGYKNRINEQKIQLTEIYEHVNFRRYMYSAFIIKPLIVRIRNEK